jgi:hypothetical protein
MMMSGSEWRLWLVRVLGVTDAAVVIRLSRRLCFTRRGLGVSRISIHVMWMGRLGLHWVRTAVPLLCSCAELGSTDI